MTPDQQARERLAREATPEVWRLCYFVDSITGEPYADIDAIVADFRRTVEQSDGLIMHGVSVDESDPARVISHTGNGPRSAANAAHIAANSPSVILADLARLRALEDELTDVASKLAVEDARTTLQAKTIRALEEAHEHLTRELALAHAEADAATERVQHLLTTIDVERTARKEAAEEVARLRGALEEVRQAVSHPLMSRDVSADARAAILPTIDAALHAQDTEVGR